MRKTILSLLVELLLLLGLAAGASKMFSPQIVSLGPQKSIPIATNHPR